MSLTHDTWMRLALEQADCALLTHDVPIGAVVVRDDGILLSAAPNRREADSDPTAHAEILALRAAAATRGHWRLHDCTLYVTLEPCAMCAGALINARIGTVVYAAHDPKAGALTSLFQLGADPRLNHRFEVVSDVLIEESQQRLRDFFRQLRALGQK